MMMRAGTAAFIALRRPLIDYPSRFVNDMPDITTLNSTDVQSVNKFWSAVTLRSFQEDKDKRMYVNNLPHVLV